MPRLVRNQRFWRHRGINATEVKERCHRSSWVIAQILIAHKHPLTSVEGLHVAHDCCIRSCPRRCRSRGLNPRVVSPRIRRPLRLALGALP